MKSADYWLIALSSLFLLAVNWLAFHDFREPHATRDWLMLAASLLVFIEYGRLFRTRSAR